MSRHRFDRSTVPTVEQINARITLLLAMDWRKRGRSAHRRGRVTR